MDKGTLVEYIRSNVYENETYDITGETLQGTLVEMVDKLYKPDIEIEFKSNSPNLTVEKIGDTHHFNLAYTFERVKTFNKGNEFKLPATLTGTTPGYTFDYDRDEIYLIACGSGTTASNQAYKIDIKTGVKTNLPNYPSAHFYSECLYYKNYIYLFGGFTTTTASLRTAYRFNVITGGTQSNPGTGWERLADLPSGSGLHQLAGYTDKDGMDVIHLSGCCATSSTPSRIVFRYRIDTNTYLPNLQYPVSQRSASSSVLVENEDGRYVYTFGGFTGSTSINDSFRYNIETETYERIANYPVTTCIAAAVLDDRGENIIIYTAYTGNAGSNTCYQYNLKSNTYKQMTNAPLSNYTMGGYKYNGALYVMAPYTSLSNALAIVRDIDVMWVKKDGYILVDGECKIYRDNGTTQSIAPNTETKITESGQLQVLYDDTLKWYSSNNTHQTIQKLISGKVRYTDNEVPNHDSPHLWEPGIEYNFHDGSFGIRLTGTYTNVSNNIQYQEIYNTGCPINFISTGGWYQHGTNNSKMALGHTSASASNFNGQECGLMGHNIANNIWVGFKGQSGTPLESKFDVWVRYTKDQS